MAQLRSRKRAHVIQVGPPTITSLHLSPLPCSSDVDSEDSNAEDAEGNEYPEEEDDDDEDDEGEGDANNNNRRGQGEDAHGYVGADAERYRRDLANKAFEESDWWRPMSRSKGRGDYVQHEEDAYPAGGDDGEEDEEEGEEDA